MSHLQMVLYEGYLGADPEFRYTPGGKAVCSFRLGSTRQYNDVQGTAVKVTTWLRCTVWGKLAEDVVNKYCKKGSHVIVQGQLKPGDNGSPTVYELKATGGHGASYEVTVSEIRLLDTKTAATSAAHEEEEEDNSDLPFN
jgi:single stranded DNA-binding protein